MYIVYTNKKIQMKNKGKLFEDLEVVYFSPEFNDMRERGRREWKPNEFSKNALKVVERSIWLGQDGENLKNSALINRNRVNFDKNDTDKGIGLERGK